ncbi:MAG: hypothetical protein IPG96_02295 [Proteobacteria bacterium]|nr:hypothetical protein [Pseudomonadota bacterium]
MTTARSRHTATLLADGTILVAGGVGAGSGALDSAERYDPRTDTWQAAGTMTTGHVFHEAVRLPDGRVLIVGGCANTWASCTYVGAELFDPTKPAAEAWTATAAMPKYRRSHRATLLNNGEVVVTGGYDNAGEHLTINLFNAQTNTWRSPLGALSVGRNLATVTKLDDGRVLIVGGTDGTTVHDSLEVYDPSTGQATTLAAKLSQARFDHTATRLADRRVLFRRRGLLARIGLLGRRGGALRSRERQYQLGRRTLLVRASASSHAAGRRPRAGVRRPRRTLG